MKDILLTAFVIALIGSLFAYSVWYSKQVDKVGDLLDEQGITAIDIQGNFYQSGVHNSK